MNQKETGKTNPVYSHQSDTNETATQAGGGIFEMVRRISWGSVFAAVLIAIVIQIALSLLGIGIGLSTVDPKTEANPVAGLGAASAIWYTISSLIALYAGGWIAGRLAVTRRQFDGVIHGLLAWSLVTLITLYFLTTTIGSILGGVGKLVGNTLGAAGNIAAKGVEAAAPAVKDAMKEQGVDLGTLKEEATTLLRQTGKPALQPAALSKQLDSAGKQAGNSAGAVASNPQQTDADVNGLLDRLLNQGKGVASQVDKDAVVNVIIARTGKSRAEANQVADNWIAASKQAAAKWEQTKQQAEAKTREIADQAASAASTAAILTFVSLLLGAGVSAYGASRGTRSKENENTVEPVLAIQPA